MISRVKMIQYGSTFWSWIVWISRKVRKELISPRKPAWVLIFMTAANVAVIMMIGWSKFFSFFDRNYVFFLGSQFSVFVIITALAYKDKKKDNVNKMNWMASAFILFLVIGFIFGHGGFQSWTKERDIDATNAAPASQKISGTVTGNRIVATAPVGRFSGWYEIMDNHHFVSDPQGKVSVEEYTTGGEIISFNDSPKERIYLKDVEIRKIRYSSLEGAPVKVVLSQFKK